MPVAEIDRTNARIRVSAKAIIVHEGKILLITEQLHGQDVAVFGSGTQILHDFPGGGIEPGESLQEALKREVKEEVNLEVEIDKPVGSWNKFNRFDNELVHMICVVYQCHIIGSPEIDFTQNPAEEDIIETRWVSKEELLNSPELFRIPDDTMSTLRHVTIE